MTNHRNVTTNVKEIQMIFFGGGDLLFQTNIFWFKTQLYLVCNFKILNKYIFLISQF